MTDPRDYRPDYPGAMDFGDTIVGQFCVCGNDMFRAFIKFDEEGNIAGWMLEGECVQCGSRFKLPYPNYQNEESELN